LGGAVNFAGKCVLGIGAGCLERVQEALGAGAVMAELVKVSPDDDLDPSVELAAWQGRRECEGSVVLRNATGTTLVDEGIWDVILAHGVPQQHLLAVLGRAQKALKPDGVLVTDKGLVEGGLGDLSPLEPVAAASRPGNGILHVHNVRRCGGTGNFVHDMARCFPEFRHTALCVNDARGDRTWIEHVSPDMRTFYAPMLTREIVEEVNPRIVILHSTAGRSLGTGDVKADWPYEWLGGAGERYTIFFHHSRTYPLVPVDLDVFVSSYISEIFARFRGKNMKGWIELPPCMDLEPYAAIPRKQEDYARRAVTSAGKASKHLREITANGASWFGPAWTFDHDPPLTAGGLASYLGDYPYALIWSQQPETWCRTVTEALAAGCLTIAGRDGAIPEQIEHEKNGFLFASAEGLTAVLDRVKDMPLDEIAEIAANGRQWAIEHAGFNRLRAGLYPYLMHGILSTS
jgi:hypothetical protein